jgi:hypothetical protein
MGKNNTIAVVLFATNSNCRGGTITRSGNPYYETYAEDIHAVKKIPV